MVNEKWRPIEGYPDYLVSNTGKIWSNKTDKMLKVSYNQRGYEIVKLLNENGEHSLSVHRLVAKAFIQNPNDKRTVNHIDCNKRNNTVENLEWATDSEQIYHAYANGLKENTRKASRNNKISDACKEGQLNRHAPILCLETNEIFRSQKELAEHLNLYASNICHVLKGRLSNTGGYHFEYVNKD